MKRETKESGKTNLANVDAGVSEEEKLVRARDDDGPKEAEDPSAERRGRYRGIVRVGYRGSDFWVRRFVFESDGRRVKVGVVDEGLRCVCVRERENVRPNAEGELTSAIPS
jgi:hypothetical protein